MNISIVIGEFPETKINLNWTLLKTSYLNYLVNGFLNQSFPICKIAKKNKITPAKLTMASMSSRVSGIKTSNLDNTDLAQNKAKADEIKSIRQDFSFL